MAHSRLRLRLPRTPAEQEERTALLFRVAIGAALLLGVLIRAFYVLSANFPLNDGGMFYAMVRDLQATKYRLPAFTSYNFSDIPYGYPPLGFYVAALLDALTPLTLFDVFRVLPLVVTSLTLVAFFLLARSMLASRAAVVASVVAFAVLPRSFLWMLMGGGLTRSFGFLFAILALHQVHLLFTRRRWWYAAPATLFSALTVLSHLGTAPFLAFSILLFFIFHGRHRHGVVSSVVVALVTIVLTAPWWATVVAQHGPEPFFAARATGGSFFSDPDARRWVLHNLVRLGAGVMGEAFFPLLSATALLGALVSLARSQLLLPVWWVTILVLEERAAGTYATLPVTMLTGLGVAAVMVPLLSNSGGVGEPDRLGGGSSVQYGGAWLRRPAALFRTSLPALVFGFLVLYTTVSAFSGLIFDSDHSLKALRPQERAAMRWVATETPASSRFLVFGASAWQTDKVAEWFPVLAARESVTTVQGTEWLPHNSFAEKESAHTQLQQCVDASTACIADWVERTGAHFTHVYITKTCCGPLISSLAEDPHYRLLYDGSGAAIFAVQ